MFDYFWYYSNNAHHFDCEDNPSKGLDNYFFQSDDINLHSTVELGIADMMFMLVSMPLTLMQGFPLCIADVARVDAALTLMQGRSGITEENIQRWIISTTNQLISI